MPQVEDMVSMITALVGRKQRFGVGSLSGSIVRSSQNGGEDLEYLWERLAGTQQGGIGELFTADNENTACQPEVLPLRSPQEVRRICC